MFPSFLTFLLAGGLTAWGLWCAQGSQLDALPDLSDTQVIVATEWMGRSPTLIENQVTYPIVTTFMGAPAIKTVRGFTTFGALFQIGTLTMSDCALGLGVGLLPVTVLELTKRANEEAARENSRGLGRLTGKGARCRRAPRGAHRYA